MVYFAFSHNFGNGHTLKHWFIKDRSPEWYLTREEFKDGFIRIVASCGDVFRNDFKNMKEAHRYINSKLIA